MNFSKSPPGKSLDFFNGREEVVDPLSFLAACVSARAFGEAASEPVRLASFFVAGDDFLAGDSLEGLTLPLLPLILEASLFGVDFSVDFGVDFGVDFFALADFPPSTEAAFFPLAFSGETIAATFCLEDVFFELLVVFLPLSLTLIEVLLFVVLSLADFEADAFFTGTFSEEVFFLTACVLEA